VNKQQQEGSPHQRELQPVGFSGLFMAVVRADNLVAKSVGNVPSELSKTDAEEANG
jgi:hypothetical protein